MGEDRKDWRITVTLTKTQEDAIVSMRKRDEYCRLSFGEIVRQLIDAGLKATSKTKR